MNKITNLKLKDHARIVPWYNLPYKDFTSFRAVRSETAVSLLLLCQIPLDNCRLLVLSKMLFKLSWDFAFLCFPTFCPSTDCSVLKGNLVVKESRKYYVCLFNN